MQDKNVLTRQTDVLSLNCLHKIERKGGAAVFDRSKLVAAMELKGYSGKDIARVINMSYRNFTRRMASGSWRSDEIETIADLLDIDIGEIFFAKRLS